MTFGKIKPKALTFISPFEGRMSYLLAGLSHYYQIDAYYCASEHFSHKWQMFYRWLYNKDIRFIRYNNTPEEMLAVPEGYDAVFVEYAMVMTFFQGSGYHDKLLAFLQKLRAKAKRMYWSEVGEHQFYMFGRPQFWEMVDGVLKFQVFKPEYNHLLKDLMQISKFQDPVLAQDAELVKENMNFEIDKYYHKIYPFPLPHSIVDNSALAWAKHRRIYDIAGNTRSGGNGALRYTVIREIQKRLDKQYTYSFDYDDKGWESNVSYWQRRLNPFYGIRKFRFGELFFRVLHYRLFYPGPLYFHNLSNAKCYLGLPWTFSSMRTADTWQAHTVLLCFSFKKCNYGIPVKDGYNYVSLGERDEITDDNVHLKGEYMPQIMDKIHAILGDERKQKEIIKNQVATYKEYCISPKQFVKKIFIEKIGGMPE